ncbi:hypothetical protein [Actinomadura algeriensis]|uniref:Uncharacterized protein n=1 Tax=Actinomadura algeriensis TaxID=1679523 RepID=A0ABR9JZA1_9ACTN|nr:hypothetical protein [Actinomadura algeriensis]MBE1535896.1 hypothetical protein [Actinomadura algeriensis]
MTDANRQGTIRSGAACDSGAVSDPDRDDDKPAVSVVEPHPLTPHERRSYCDDDVNFMWTRRVRPVARTLIREEPA